MTFHVGEAIDFGDQMENGPLVVYWGQTEYIPRAHDAKPLAWPEEPPKLTWRQRRKRCRPFKILIRVEPPEGEPLDEWCGRVSAALGVTYDAGGRRPHHKALFAPAVGNYQSAAEGLGAAAAVLQRLAGFGVSALQVEVERWKEARR